MRYIALLRGINVGGDLGSSALCEPRKKLAFGFCFVSFSCVS